MTLAEARKTVAAVLAAAVTIGGEAVTAGLAHGAAARWLSLAVAVLVTLAGAVAVYTVPNAPLVRPGPRNAAAWPPLTPGENVAQGLAYAERTYGTSSTGTSPATETVTPPDRKP